MLIKSEETEKSKQRKGRSFSNSRDIDSSLEFTERESENEKICTVIRLIHTLPNELMFWKKTILTIVDIR